MARTPYSHLKGIRNYSAYHYATKYGRYRAKAQAAVRGLYKFRLAPRYRALATAVVRNKMYRNKKKYVRSVRKRLRRMGYKWSRWGSNY